MDLIERQTAIDVINESNSPIAEYLIGEIMALSSAHPERKWGKWIDNSNGIEGAWNYCSVCGEQAIDLYDYCPNCGADMRGDKNG